MGISDGYTAANDRFNNASQEQRTMASTAPMGDPQSPHHRSKRANRRSGHVIKFAFIALLIGILVGVIGTIALQGHLPFQAGQKEHDVSVVFGRVMSQNELVTASQDYMVTDKTTDRNEIAGFVIPFSETDIWYRCAGTIKVAVDLSKAELVSVDGNTIKIRLEEPYISSNTPDLEKSGTIATYESILNPTHPKDVDEAQRTISEKLIEAAKEGDIFDRAKENAKNDLSRLFSVALDDNYTVEIEWKPAEE